MYDIQEYNDCKEQQKRRWIFLSVPAVLLLGATLVSFFLRWGEIITIVLSCATSIYCIFCYGMFVSPVVAYAKHMEDVFHGRTRQLTGTFKSMEENAVWRDGVSYYPMMLNIGDMDDEQDDRLFYYDANKERPNWQVGERLTVTSHDKTVTDWQRAS